MVHHLVMSGHRPTCMLPIKTAHWRDCNISNGLVIIQVRVTPPLIHTIDIFLECLEYVFCILSLSDPTYERYLISYQVHHS